MRILHVIPAYYPATYWGGPITSVYGLNNALAALPDTEIRVLASDSAGPRLNQKILASALDGAALYPGQQVTFTRRIAGNDFSPAMLRRLPAQIAWADIVHLTAVYSFPTLPVLLLCRLQNKPLVWSLRGALQDAQSLPFARKKMLKALWNRLCLALLQPQKTVLHATSPLEKELSARGLPGIETAVIRNGVETPAQMPQRQFRPNGQLRLLFLSRLDRKKGLENLLEALTLLSDLPISFPSSAPATKRISGLCSNWLSLLDCHKRRFVFTATPTGRPNATPFSTRMFSSCPRIPKITAW